MKKITTAAAMIALALTLSTMALGQNEKRNKPGTPARPGNVIDADGWPIGHLRGVTGKAQEIGRKEFDKGYLSPRASMGYRGTTTVSQGAFNNLTFDGGRGNGTLNTTTKSRRVAGDWNGDGKDAIGCRRAFNDCTGPFGYSHVRQNNAAHSIRGGASNTQVTGETGRFRQNPAGSSPLINSYGKPKTSSLGNQAIQFTSHTLPATDGLYLLRSRAGTRPGSK
ncbi:MAG TPA: hypothetical protein VFD58_23900 [Blastocatellia bacterium]|nr:hypothetical protein [Blastocatellia bacterium]